MEFTLSVRSFHVPETPGTVGLAAELALGADLAGHPGDLVGEGRELVDHRVDGVLQLERARPAASTVIFWDRSPLATAVVTWAMLRTWPVRLAASWLTLSVRSFHVPRHAGHDGLAAERPSVPTSRATRVTSSAKARSWSTIVLMVSFSSATSPRASTVIFWDRSPLATAVVTWAMLRTWLGEVGGQLVDVVGEVLPGAGHARHLGLAAEAALGADLAGDTGDLVGEGRGAGRPSC